MKSIMRPTIWKSAEVPGREPHRVDQEHACCSSRAMSRSNGIKNAMTVRISTGFPPAAEQTDQENELNHRQATSRHRPALPARRASGATGSDLRQSMWTMSPRNAQGSCIEKMKVKYAMNPTPMIDTKSGPAGFRFDDERHDRDDDADPERDDQGVPGGANGNQDLPPRQRAGAAQPGKPSQADARRLLRGRQ